MSPAQQRLLADLRELGGRLECYSDRRWRFSAPGMRSEIVRGASVDALLHAGALEDTSCGVGIERTLVPKPDSEST